jgi:hypothetical protein
VNWIGNRSVSILYNSTPLISFVYKYLGKILSTLSLDDFLCVNARESDHPLIVIALVVFKLGWLGQHFPA